jgi:hypothetical protein
MQDNEYLRGKRISPKPHWYSLDRFDHTPAKLEGWSIFYEASPTTGVEAVMREAEMEAARERARLSVLTLTEKDKRFLKSLKVAY